MRKARQSAFWIGRWRRLPRLIRLFIVNGSAGAALGAILAGALIATNAVGLRTLIVNSSDPTTPIAMLVVGFSSLFATLVIAAAAMAGDQDD